MMAWVTMWSSDQVTVAQALGGNASALLPIPCTGECLPGDKHKELASPEPEGPGYAACLQWREETCCTAEFTQQLEEATVTNIDGFHWNRCGDLSPSCQEFFVRVECFYRSVNHFLAPRQMIIVSWFHAAALLMWLTGLCWSLTVPWPTCPSVGSSVTSGLMPAQMT